MNPSGPLRPTIERKVTDIYQGIITAAASDFNKEYRRSDLIMIPHRLLIDNSIQFIVYTHSGTTQNRFSENRHGKVNYSKAAFKIKLNKIQNTIRK